MQPPQPPYGQPPVQQAPYGPPPGLVAPLGAPRRVPGGLRAGALALLGVLLVLASALGGYEVAHAGITKWEAILHLLPAIAVMLGMLFIWQGTVWSVRSDGWVLEGSGLLGRHGIDLTRLTAVGSTANARATQLVLRDDVAGLTVDAKALHKAGPAVVDVVGRAVWAGQEQGRYVVSRGAAGVWGMPTRVDAPANGRTGATPRALVVVGLLTAGLVVGIVLRLA